MLRRPFVILASCVGALALIVVAVLPLYQAYLAFVDAQRELTAQIDAANRYVERVLHHPGMARYSPPPGYWPLQYRKRDLPPLPFDGRID